ncbi:hypothetical protein EHQ52_03715 [Leptospira koniambonensis]|uniref:Uncharacterized protein n=1 Tax=Leptospira koniambonensis TaxID=2484950 RepID=A0A4R9JD52_9LEPT|nr:hypothetical protein [Leptospira koniambonensis]TGL36989.1 hypothetical protein EHQ52_03715 [Leptospira koniambonensis]
MEVKFDISNAELTDSDKDIIKSSLGLTNNVELKKSLEKIAKASFLEYRKMFIERGVPTKADEVLQEKLFYLIKHYFIEKLPTEAGISTIFQLTPSSSKTLLKNTISRYRIHLEEIIRNSIKEVLGDIERTDDKVKIVIQSDNIKDQINMVIAQKKPTLKKLISVKSSAGQYECPKDTFAFLESEFL